MRPIAEIIEEAYELFAPYTLGASLCICKCSVCCITDADEQVLLTTPLRETTSYMLFRGYYESACYHTDRENWEMKHFLPRVLELVSEFDFPGHSMEITFLRLDFDQLNYWLPAERELLAAFALAFFESCLGCYPLPSGDALADVLLMFGLAHFDLAPLLLAWTHTDRPSSLAHFAHLLLDDLQYAPLALQNPFSEPFVNHQLATWLTNPPVQATWKSRLGQAIRQNQLPADQAERVSWAYDLLPIQLA